MTTQEASYRIVALSHGNAGTRAATAPAGGAATTYRREQASSLRLTTRGRVVVLIFFIVVAFGAFVLALPTSAAIVEQGEGIRARTVVAQEGDTLWEIAEDVAEPGEVREMVYRIKQLNALADSGIDVGQSIAVPVEP